MVSPFGVYAQDALAHMLPCGKCLFTTVTRHILVSFLGSRLERPAAAHTLPCLLLPLPFTPVSCHCQYNIMAHTKSLPVQPHHPFCGLAQTVSLPEVVSQVQMSPSYLIDKGIEAEEVLLTSAAYSRPCHFSQHPVLLLRMGTSVQSCLCWTLQSLL